MKCRNCSADTPAFVEICPGCGFNPRTAQRVAEITRNPAIKEARLTKRFINFILDSVFYAVLILIFILFLTNVIENLENAGMMPDFFYKYYNEIFDSFFADIMGILLFFLYYAYPEFKYNRTIGKFFTGTKVVLINGEKPDIRTILLRTLCRLIPLDALSYIFTREPGLHDRYSKTMVVDNDFRPDRISY